jgi:hypothetical protein
MEYYTTVVDFARNEWIESIESIESINQSSYIATVPFFAATVVSYKNKTIMHCTYNCCGILYVEITNKQQKRE